MDKLVFNRPKPKESRRTGKGEVIRITDDAYEILSGISAETGKAIGFIASEMIKFSEKYTFIEDEKYGA